MFTPVLSAWADTPCWGSPISPIFTLLRLSIYILSYWLNLISSLPCRISIAHKELSLTFPFHLALSVVSPDRYPSSLDALSIPLSLWKPMPNKFFLWIFPVYATSPTFHAGRLSIRHLWYSAAPKCYRTELTRKIKGQREELDCIFIQY